MYLLDTNVVSELRRKKPHEAVVAWLKNIDDRDLRVSAITLGEIQAGIEITRDRDPEKAAEIEIWLGRVASTWNVLPTDGATFRLWAKLMHGRSQTLGDDAMIAAMAKQHDLIIVTRNIRDFRDFDVRVVDPYATPRLS